MFYYDEDDYPIPVLNIELKRELASMDSSSMAYRKYTTKKNQEEDLFIDEEEAHNEHIKKIEQDKRRYTQADITKRRRELQELYYRIYDEQMELLNDGWSTETDVAIELGRIRLLHAQIIKDMEENNV